MKIDSNRDVVIIGHPRSGSFWFQSCLPHFNCLEAFNTVNLDLLDRNQRGFVMPRYRSRLMDLSEEQQEIQSRIRLLDSIERPKSVKILTFQFMYAHRTQWNHNIFDWVNRQDATVVWIKRRDRLSALKSLMIADALGKYLGPIAAQSVMVDLGRVPWLLDSISYDRDAYIVSQLKVPFESVYYEDLLADPEFDKSQSHMQEQHTTQVEITNWSQVVDCIPKDQRHDYTL